MRKAALVVVAFALLAAETALAQDIAGLEDCTKTNGLDKRTGCFQSNVDVLSRMIMKNAADAQQKLNAANAQIAALQRSLGDLQRSLGDLQMRVETLEKAAKKSGAKP